MLSRYDALRRVVPLMAASDAVAVLDQPLDALTNPTEPQDLRNIHSPVEFARGMEAHGLAQLDEWPDLAPAEWVEFLNALKNLRRAVPALAEPANDLLVELVLEAALSHSTTISMAALRAGAAFESARLALLTPMQLCPTCKGGEHAMDGPPCPTCGGRGLVPTPGVIAH